MENKIKNLDEKWYEHRQFPKGYGQFPYFIFKAGHAMYMQIPVHFNAKGDFESFPGTSVEGVTDAEIAEYAQNKKGLLHQKLIERGHWIKNKIESNRNKPCRICLVEGPNLAHYFEEGEIDFSDSIPSGGTLLTQQNKVIAMNVPHYL